MKKAFSLFAALMILFASGCEKQTSRKNQALPPAPSAFTANLDVDFNSIQMTATLTKNESDNYTVQILTPEILSPLSEADL